MSGKQHIAGWQPVLGLSPAVKEKRELPPDMATWYYSTKFFF